MRKVHLDKHFVIKPVAAREGVLLYHKDKERKERKKRKVQVEQSGDVGVSEGIEKQKKNAEAESCTIQTAAHQSFFFLFLSHSEVMQLFSFKRRLSKVSLPLTISPFGAMTQPKHRDAYITEP